MLIDEVQADIPDLVSNARRIVTDLESAESCEVKADLCANLHSARIYLDILKREVSKLVRQAEKCSR